jgi:anti-sigma factor RsiW
MFTRHVSRQLAAHIDGQLEQKTARRTELHLNHCQGCQEECEQVKRGMTALEHLPLAEAPEAMWFFIESAIPENQSRRKPLAMRWGWALAATVAIALAVAVYWRIEHPSGARWEIVRLEGSPSVGTKPMGGVNEIGAGDWIETDARSSAMLKIGEIGSVKIAPNTRLRVVTARPDDHRLTLTRGEIQAKISAPPRLFFVNTASGTAVDLGCEYTLSTDEAGFGLLRVTKGWVAFQWKGLESLVPAGASCRTQPQAGPGIPYFDDASDSLKQALEAFSSEKAADDALAVILFEARVRDTLTLWHLLSRVSLEDRARVFDRIAVLTPIPAGVSRDLALRLDPQTLNHWKEELAWTW